MEVTFPLGNLIPEIISEDNMGESFDYLISHLEHVRQREMYRPKRQTIIESLRREISAGSFRITRSDVRDLHVTEGYKERDVQAPTVVKRVGIHAIMVVVERYTYPTLITNTAASIKGRGMHWLHHIVEEDLVNAPEQTQYYYKSDISHYYDSIDQWQMKRVIRQYVSDPVLLPILDCFITLMPEGLSKGLRSSQCFANLYLSEVDHYMLRHVQRYEKDGETRYLYYRYCDDTVMLAGDKRELWRLRDLHVAAAPGPDGEEQRGRASGDRRTGLPRLRALRHPHAAKEAHQADGSTQVGEGEVEEAQAADNRLVQGHGVPCRLQAFIPYTNRQEDEKVL
jgi:hypothetical protein